MRIVATDEDAGFRLDQWLAARAPGLSRSQVQRLIRGGHVVLDRGPVKTGLIVTPGLAAEITFPPPAPATVEPEALPLAILYEDPDVVIVDKPAGMVVHPSAGHARGTLVNALVHHVGGSTEGLSGAGGAARPGVVHRLDRGTSGVMVIARNDRAHRNLAQQFHDRVVGKEYVALVWGTPRAPHRIESAIGRDPRTRQKMSSRAQRRRTASTTIEAVEPLRGVAFVRISIATGRTHQIRVHLSEIGHPVVGDALYGGVRKRLPTHLAPLAALDRPFLHARRLTFAHPADGRTMTFTAPVPDDLERILQALRRKVS